jgi:hypothetical protein
MKELKIKTIDYNKIIISHLLMLSMQGHSCLPAGHGLINVSVRSN